MKMMIGIKKLRRKGKVYSKRIVKVRNRIIVQVLHQLLKKLVKIQIHLIRIVVPVVVVMMNLKNNKINKNNKLNKLNKMK
jgi:hypothetical protein